MICTSLERLENFMLKMFPDEEGLKECVLSLWNLIFKRHLIVFRTRNDRLYVFYTSANEFFISLLKKVVSRALRARNHVVLYVSFNVLTSTALFDTRARWYLYL